MLVWRRFLVAGATVCTIASGCGGSTTKGQPGASGCEIVCKGNDTCGSHDPSCIADCMEILRKISASESCWRAFDKLLKCDVREGTLVCQDGTGGERGGQGYSMPELDTCAAETAENNCLCSNLC